MRSLTLIIILILGTGIAFSDDNDGMNSMESEESNTMMMSDTMMSDTMMSDSESFMTGGKIDFTTLEYAMEIALFGPTVLFFYADWCPTCRSALNDIDANIDQLVDVTVIVVNYDKAKELIKKYGIVYQHTFVQINSSGERLVLWNGGGVKNILKHVVEEEEN